MVGTVTLASSLAYTCKAHSSLCVASLHDFLYNYQYDYQYIIIVIFTSLIRSSKWRRAPRGIPNSLKCSSFSIRINDAPRNLASG